MLNAVIVGCGKIGGIFDRKNGAFSMSHAAAYYRNRSITVVAYVDRNIKRAKKLASLYGSHSYSTDFRDAIERYRPQVVSVCTPDATHFAIAKSILELHTTPKVLFVEKPVCSTAAEFKTLSDLARRKDVALLVNHTRRFDDTVQRIRRLVTSGSLGRLVRGDVFYYGGWRHIGVHLVDMMIFLFNDSLRLYAAPRMLGVTDNDDPLLAAEFLLRSCKSPVYFHPFDEGYYQICDIDLKFDKARLKIENFGERYILERRRINRLGERILVSAGLKGRPGRRSPIDNAVDKIVKYLKSGADNVISDYCIEKAEATMKAIWDGEKRYASNLR